jgi:hypothetical protein
MHQKLKQEAVVDLVVVQLVDQKQVEAAVVGLNN